MSASMWLGPPCPVCGQPIDSVSRSAGRRHEDDPIEPSQAAAGPCGCELTDGQAAQLRRPA